MDVPFMVLIVVIAVVIMYAFIGLAFFWLLNQLDFTIVVLWDLFFQHFLHLQYDITSGM